LSLRLSILTGLPEYFEAASATAHIRIAQEKRAIEIDLINLRDYASDAYRSIDDEPYGGGGGMVLKPEPVWKALAALHALPDTTQTDSEESREGEVRPKAVKKIPWVVLPTPKGKRLKQDDFVRLSGKEHIVFLCSRYKGIDERIRGWVDEELSLGDYVIGGGELAALVVIEGIVRLLDGVVGARESVETDSYTCGMLSAPVYTRPEEFNSERVPAVLLSGHHAEIERWRRKKIIELTLARRPDLLAKMRLDKDDETLLSEVISEQACRS